MENIKDRKVFTYYVTMCFGILLLIGPIVAMDRFVGSTIDFMIGTVYNLQGPAEAELSVPNLPSPITVDTTPAPEQSKVESTKLGQDTTSPVPQEHDNFWLLVGDKVTDWLVKIAGCVATILGALGIQRNRSRRKTD